MKKEEFEALVKKDKFQIFLFCCPASFPLCFAVHPWFVVNKKGQLSRWEVVSGGWSHKAKWGYLYKDFCPPWYGISIIYRLNMWKWDSKILSSIEGDENSTAAKIAAFIENSKDAYPFRHIYRYLGPNSNTYVQWVLNNFPEFKAELPPNAIGKNFRFQNII